MSQDLRHAKRNIGSIYPEKVYDSTGMERIEALLTPLQFKERFYLVFQ